LVWTNNSILVVESVVFMIPLVVVVGRIQEGITREISQEGEMGQTYIRE